MYACEGLSNTWKKNSSWLQFLWTRGFPLMHQQEAVNYMDQYD